MDLSNIPELRSHLSQTKRPIRLRLSYRNQVLDHVLLVKHVYGREALCGGLEYRVLCLSTQVGLPLKEFIALPAEVQFVTDQGRLHSVCGIVAQVSAGESDGGLATYHLLLRDALTLMEQRINTRVFRNKHEVEISETLIKEWRKVNPILARVFDIDVSGVTGSYPAREFTMQNNESDAAFLRRLWRRQGLAWMVRHGGSGHSGSSNVPTHTIALFDDPYSLAENAAGRVRFHRDAGTEKRDGIFNWSAIRTLMPGSVTRQSWDYRQTRMMRAQVPTNMRQGSAGDQFAYGMEDHRIEAPHTGNDNNDYLRLGELRMERIECNAKCFKGESGVRDFAVGQWFCLEGHPDRREQSS